MRNAAVESRSRARRLQHAAKQGWGRPGAVAAGHSANLPATAGGLDDVLGWPVHIWTPVVLDPRVHAAERRNRMVLRPCHKLRPTCVDVPNICAELSALSRALCAVLCAFLLNARVGRRLIKSHRQRKAKSQTCLGPCTSRRKTACGLTVSVVTAERRVLVKQKPQHTHVIA